ncbi:DUF445 domain-containing protein [Ectobacillus sp. JY-23]|uniref:DUF445 domain-containing protein n=1 Tax=Ectobacillus sp. JY-23 TaxID=2933872 RepID=UPI001FF6D30D|nr:DUF445 domain-containing protein [Ectobacillus sp. JY-23]UOY92737.1 DUF445 domain-containing protein [Ectobacillus sp. JY-23]
MAPKSKYLAGTSLAVMGAGFLSTLPLDTTTGVILHGAFEAGLVGGLADWFAVTALFRHPLGIPIPHTALLPKNRQRVTTGLIHMLEHEWLTKESIMEKLQKADIISKLLAWLEAKLHTNATRTAVITIARKLLEHVQPEMLAPYIEKELKQYVLSADTKRIVTLIIDRILQDRYDEKALDYILIKAKHWAEKEETKTTLGNVALKAIQNIELDGFLQFALKSFINVIDADKLGGFIQEFIIGGIHSLQNEENDNRRSLLEKLQSELEKGKSNEELINSIDSWKTSILDSYSMSSLLTDLLTNIKQRALTFVQTDAFVERYAIPLLEKMVAWLKQPSYKIHIEHSLHKQIAGFIETNHHKIGKLVQENLDKLDDNTLIAMIENNVGKDLQWIRVNGAVCGFIIGLLLETGKIFI